MARPARRELLDSALSYPRSGENRLTELFATVLDVHDGLASALFEEVDTDHGGSFAALPQERVAPGCKPDLVIESRSLNGHLVSQLWCEHKTISGYRESQMEDYCKAAMSARPPTTVLTITRDRQERNDGWKSLTWQVIGELVDQVGRKWGEGAWRTRALFADAPARERLLHEFLWYLGKEGLAMVDALDGDDVSVYRRMIPTVLALETLMGRAQDRMTTLTPSGADGSDDLTILDHLRAPAGIVVVANGRL